MRRHVALALLALPGLAGCLTAEPTVQEADLHVHLHFQPETNRTLLVTVFHGGAQALRGEVGPGALLTVRVPEGRAHVSVLWGNVSRPGENSTGIDVDVRWPGAKAALGKHDGEPFWSVEACTAPPSGGVSC